MFLFDVAVNMPLQSLLDKIIITCFSVWPTVFVDMSLVSDKTDAARKNVGSSAIFLSVQVLAIYQSSKVEDSQLYKVISSFSMYFLVNFTNSNISYRK